jgi:hypothetical protein
MTSTEKGRMNMSTELQDQVYAIRDQAVTLAVTNRDNTPLLLAHARDLREQVRALISDLTNGGN